MAKNWAIVIGINLYEHLQPLKYAKQDAQLMKEFLQKAGFDEIFFFSDDSPDIRGKSTRPNRSNLLLVLQDLFEKPSLEAEDNFWFFFAGHGMRHDNDDYLMPCDGFLGGGGIENTAIKITYITKRLRLCGADNVVLILDACRNQGSRSGEGIGKQTAEQARQTGVITIFSCAPDELSYEIDDLKQGAFTYTLLKGLRSQGRCATVEQLDQYLIEQVPQLSRQYKKPIQNPYTIVEPRAKSHMILLPQNATKEDIKTLELDADRATQEGDSELAERLGIRINEAVRELEKIGRKRLRVTIIGVSIVSTLALVLVGLVSSGSHQDPPPVDSQPIESQPRVPPCDPTEDLCKIFPQVGIGTVTVWALDDNGRTYPSYEPTYEYVLNDNDRDCGGSDSPVVLKLEYEFHENQVHSGWSVGWHKHFDISKFSTLSFRIKGVSGNGEFEVGLKDMQGIGDGFKQRVVASSDWKEKSIPLSDFGAEIKRSEIQNINFGFLSKNGPGTICIDKIELR